MQLSIKHASNQYFAAYQFANERDEAFSKAIKKQFGIKANRFDYGEGEYNDETMFAYIIKVKADKLMAATLKTYREAMEG